MAPKCLTCLEKHYLDATDDTCKPCSDQWSDLCVSCPAGVCDLCDDPNAELTTCTMCKVGFYKNAATGGICTPCGVANCQYCGMTGGDGETLCDMCLSSHMYLIRSGTECVADEPTCDLNGCLTCVDDEADA
jgi:hypothetical protein